MIDSSQDCFLKFGTFSSYFGGDKHSHVVRMMDYGRVVNNMSTQRPGVGRAHH